jgi:hypothetical protein
MRLFFFFAGRASAHLRIQQMIATRQNRKRSQNIRENENRAIFPTAPGSKVYKSPERLGALWHFWKV